MRLIILAAGKGSRVRGTNLPKILFGLGNGETVGSRLIRQANLPTTIVVGYMAETVMRAFGNMASFVHNPVWMHTGPVESLERAAMIFPGPSLVVYGDTVFTDSDVWKMKGLTGTAGVCVKDWYGPHLSLGRIIDDVSADQISDIGFSGILNTAIPAHLHGPSLGWAVKGYGYERVFSININTDMDLVRAREWIKSLS